VAQSFQDHGVELGGVAPVGLAVRGKLVGVDGPDGNRDLLESGRAVVAQVASSQATAASGGAAPARRTIRSISAGSVPGTNMNFRMKPSAEGL